jgi:hypothetical protein
MSLKRGKFSVEEERIMQENAHIKSFEEIGALIERSPEAVEKFLVAKGLVVETTIDDIKDKTRCLLVLHEQPFWPELDKVLIAEEMEYFENTWYAIYKQANEDISFSEHYMIKEWLILEIKKQRLLIDEKIWRARIKELAKEIDDIYASGVLSPELPKLIDEKNLKEATVSANNKIVETYSKEIRTYSKEVQLNRDKRREGNSNLDTWDGYLYRLDNDEKFRTSEAYQAEIERLAAERAKWQLMQLHTYMDGEPDYPLLSAETMEIIKEQERVAKEQEQEERDKEES